MKCQVSPNARVVSMTSQRDDFPGSSGTLLPLYQARLQREYGSEVEGFDEAGELFLASQNMAARYLGDDNADIAVIKDGWLRTGDVVVFRRSVNGCSHLFVVDRLRDMIKVKVWLQTDLVVFS